MHSIDKDWLNARGGLHDATLVSVDQSGAMIELAFDDEWVNERGLTLPEGGKSPGIMVLHSARIAKGDPVDAVGGWVSDIQWEGAALRIHFCDRDPLEFETREAMWRRELPG